MNLKNHRNQYQAMLGDDLFDRLPKAVLAAIAVSFATTGGDDLNKARLEIINEWRILNQAGIVPQPVPRNLLMELDTAEVSE